MLTSSIFNSIPFKAVDFTEPPNEDNRLVADLNQGGFNKIDYCHPWHKGDVCYLQFMDDDNTIPTLTAFFQDGSSQEISGTLASSYEGDINRYFFNFDVTLGSLYYDNKVYFEIEKGTEKLTSEPIFVEDLNEAIEKGEIKKIEYTNFDRYISDLNNRFVDWSVVDNADKVLGFYVKATTRELNIKDEVELLETTDTNIVISANNFTGVVLKTGLISRDVVNMLATSMNLDYFRVNNKEYVKPDGIDSEVVGGSTLFQCSIPLLSKYTLGFNTDDFGFEGTVENDFVMNKQRIGVSSDFDIERPEGYSLHQVLIKHSSSSSNADATVICGNELGGELYMDSFNGLITYNNGEFNTPSIPHHAPDTDAGRIYFGISGSGVVLDIYIQLLKITE